MKKETKLKLLISAAAVASVAIIAPVTVLSSSCGIQPAYKKQEYSKYFNLGKTIGAFDFDGSRLYGQFVGVSMAQNVTGRPLRAKYEGQPVITTIQIKDKEGKEATQQIVEQTTFKSLKFVLANAIVLTLDDGKTKVYDNDKAEIVPAKQSFAYTLKDGTKKTYQAYEKTTTVKTSADPKSINNPQFLEDLKKATKFQFTVKPNVHYTNIKGEKTDYTVQPEDFYYSWVRTNSITKEYREENLTSVDAAKLTDPKEKAKANADLAKTLDQDARGAVSPADLYFTADDSYPNAYLFSLFGLNYTDWDKEDKFIQKISDGELKDQKAVTFAQADGQKADFLDFFNKLFYLDYTFMPAPSQYIDAMNAAKTQPVFTYDSKTNNDVTKKLKADIEKMDPSSLMYRVGAYWYGLSPESTLYSGPYRPVKSTGLSVSIVKNTNYAEQDFVNDENTVNKVTYNYLQKAESPSDFNNRIWNYYQQGTTSETPYSQLNTVNQITVSSDPEKYGLRFTETLNKDSLVSYMTMIPYPNRKPDSKDYDSIPYGYSDAYAKMMWGVTTKDIDAGKTNGDTYIFGTGLSFRTILNSAINWVEYSSEASGGIGKPWFAKLAPDSSLGTSDATAEDTPAKYYNDINSTFAIDKDGHKIDFGNNKYYITPADGEEHIKNLSDTVAKLKSPYFNQLKQAMTDLIAKFDKENPDLAGKDFKIDYFFPYTNPGQTTTDTFKKVQQIVSALNPRIKYELKYFPDTNKPDYNAYKFKGLAGTALIAWSYDFDSIGSGYDGLSWGAYLVPMLIQTSHDLTKHPEFATNLPAIAKLAKALEVYGKANFKGGAVPFEDLYKISNKYPTSYLGGILANYDFVKDANGYYEVKMQDVPVKDKNGKEVKDEKGNVKMKKSPVRLTQPGPDIYAFSSKFWLEYIRSLTTQEAVELMREMSGFMNVNFTFGATITKEKYTRTLINKHYIVPSQLGDGFTQYVDMRVKLDKPKK